MVSALENENLFAFTSMPKRINIIRAKYPTKHIFVEYKSEVENTHRNCKRTHSPKAAAFHFHNACSLCKAPIAYSFSPAIDSHGFYL